MIASIACIYVGILLILNTDTCTHKIAQYASDVLGKELGTTVSIQDAQVGLFNKIELTDILVLDQQGKKALGIKNLSANLDILKILSNKLVIKHLGIYHGEFNIYRNSPKEKTNIQFIIDSLSSSKDTPEKELLIDANSVVLHDIDIKYDVLNSPTSPHKFNPEHIHIKNLSTNVLVNYIGKEQGNLRVRNLKFEEGCGVKITNCQLIAQILEDNIQLKNVSINLNKSSLKIPQAKFSIKKTKRIENLEAAAMVALSDLHYFTTIDSTFNENILKLNVTSQARGAEILTNITAQDNNKLFATDLDIFIPKSILNKAPFECKGTINSCNISSKLLEKISKISSKTEFLKKALPLGEIKQTGTFAYHEKNIQLKGSTHTDVGSLKEEIDIKDNTIQGKLQSDDIHYEKFILENQVYKNPTALDISISGLTKPLNINIISNIKQLVTQNYTYHNIKLNGQVKDNYAEGEIKVDDNNLKLTLTPQITFNGNNLSANVNANIAKLSPQSLGFVKDWENVDIASQINASYSGNSSANEIHLSMKDFNLQKNAKTFGCQTLNLDISRKSDENNLILKSDIIDASIHTEADVEQIPNIICSFVSSAFPSLKKFVKYNNSPFRNTRFNTKIKDTELISELASVPISIKEPCTINGYVNAKEKNIRVISRFPRFVYNNENYSNASFYLTGNTDTLSIVAKLTKSINKRDVNISLGIPVKDNVLSPRLKWQVDGIGTYGELNTICNFNTHADDNIANIHIAPSQISIQDTVWKINSADIELFKDRISLSPLEIRHDNQYMSIRNQNTANSPFLVSFNGFEVSPILDLVNFHSVKFAGKLYGNATIPSKIDNNLTIPAKIQVRDFLFQDGKLGTLDVLANWEGTEQRININAKTHETDNDSLLIRGYVDIDNNELELNFAPQYTNLDFVNSWLGKILGKTSGTVSGKLQLKGPLDSLDFNGRVAIDTMSFTPPLTNAPYSVSKDSVFFSEGKFVFQDFVIRDTKHGSCVVQGAVTHNKLKHFGFDLHFDANNFYAYNWDGIDRDVFWGKIYTDGYGRLHGTTTDVYADLNLTPKNGSTFYYNNSDSKETEAAEFIHFHNGKEPAVETSSGKVEEVTELMKDDETDIHFNLIANANPSTQLVIYTDRKTGDGLYLRGEGPLSMTWHNKGKFTINGQYITTGGEYHLTIQDLMKRNFKIQPKGSLSFNGDAEEGDLNLKGVYTVHSVSLSDLNFGQNISNATTNVNCLLNFGGKANNPQVTFGLEFPTAGDDISKTIKSAISSQEDINMQMLYLLTIGRFYTYDFETSANSSTQNQSVLAMQSLFANTLGNSLGNIISQALHINNWTFGPSISTGRLGFDDMEVGGQFQGSLLQNRLQLSGNFGYREQNTYSNNFVGDFNLRWLLNPKGTISLKAYSETNDRYFSKSSLSTQGGGIMFMHDFNKLNSLLGVSKKKNRTSKHKK